MSVVRGLWPAPPVPSVSIPPHVFRYARQLLALRIRAETNFTTPLAVHTANAIHAVHKICIPHNLAQFSCHDPHTTPSGTARATNSPDLRTRLSIWPITSPQRFKPQAPFSHALLKPDAFGTRRSKATPLEINLFCLRARSSVIHLHHKSARSHREPAD